MAPPILCLLLLSCLCIRTHYSVSSTPATRMGPFPLNRSQRPLLVLLIDSLRWDIVSQYSQKTNKTLNGFSKLKERSAYVERVSPVFPADCTPNLISLLTGLYPVDHGAILPQLYDEIRNKTFAVNFGDSSGEFALRSMESKLNQRVHMTHLPICSNLASENISCDTYSAEEMTPERLLVNIQNALSRLTNGSSDIVVVYYDRLDQVGHAHGPLSDELLLHELPALDKVIEQLLDSILPSYNHTINLLVTSDHGMTEVRRSVSLDRYISPTLVTKVINRGATVSIWPANNRSKELIHRLTSPRIERFTFYSRDQIPEEWHSGGVTFPPILLVAEPGYWLNSTVWSLEGGHYATPAVVRGAHGYGTLHADMHIPLFILGENIPAGRLQNISRWDQVDTHGLIVALTRSSEDHEETWKWPIFSIRTIVRDRSTWKFVFAFGVFLLLLALLSLFIVCVHHYLVPFNIGPKFTGFTKLDPTNSWTA